MTANGVNHRE
jgi:hypothetical protein